MPLGPAPLYLAKYNNYTLPGYVQSESIDSILNIADHSAAYVDGSISEDTGLANKAFTLTLKIWEQDYLTCKDQVMLAATYLRSARSTFVPLYVHYPDKHYMAMVKSISRNKDTSSSTRTLDYEVEFETKPWLIGETLHTLTGTGTVTTDDVSRDITYGGWTPTIITVTGTDITISGYTSTGDSAGFISISGTVTNLVIDSEAFTATMGSTNMNGNMLTADYRMQVGPGKTIFVTTGASDCEIKYYDRWYI